MNVDTYIQLNVYVYVMYTQYRIQHITCNIYTTPYMCIYIVCGDRSFWVQGLVPARSVLYGHGSVH